MPRGCILVADTSRIKAFQKLPHTTCQCQNDSPFFRVRGDNLGPTINIIYS